MERYKVFFWNVLLNYFDYIKSVVPAHKIFKEWFGRFNVSDFDVNDTPRAGQPKKLNMKCKTLLNENTDQTLKELDDELGVSEAVVSRNVLENTLNKINCTNFSQQMPLLIPKGM